MAARRSNDSGATSVLLAACAHELFSIEWRTGASIARWPPETLKDDDQDSNSSAEIITAESVEQNGGPAAKRRKTKRTNAAIQKSPAIANLIVSSDGSHAVATTGEDKSVHVFSIDKAGGIEHLSRRQMIKRPCAIALSADDKHILVGDKFGDVYALSLLHEPSQTVVKDTESNGVKIAPPPFKPSATDLTVHSGRNLRALESQKRQAELASLKPKEKDGMDFEHELLLGHVSMLTDVLTTRTTGVPAREYIITSDRDEHIRISRGRPQAYVIENYCFGHKQFVSKLCMATPDVLISGGGDDFLLAWDWVSGRILSRFDLRPAIEDYFVNISATPPEATTVSRLCSSRTKENYHVFVACEGVAALFRFDLKLANALPERMIATIHASFSHNVLDVVFTNEHDDDAASTRMILSLDTMRQPNTRSQSAANGSRSARLVFPSGDDAYGSDDRGSEVDDNALHASTDLMYSLEKLRKREHEDD